MHSYGLVGLQGMQPGAVDTPFAIDGIELDQHLRSFKYCAVMAQLETRLTALLDISAPVIQAPIGSLATPELAAAVSNAGGLGMLSGTFTAIDALERAVRRTQELTSKPFGVNFVLPFENRDRVDLCIEAGVKVFSFTWGELDALGAQAKAAGAFVSHTVGSAAEAAAAVDAGADVIVAQGVEAGGHVWGTTSSLALIPAVVDAAGDVPVVAAGGIGDGRGLAAALTLGASGAWLGTRFVNATESRAHEQYQRNIVNSSEANTTYTKMFDGGWPNAPHRVLTTSHVDSWIAAGSPVTNRPGDGDTVATSLTGQQIPRYDDTPPTAGMSGALDDMAQYCGQSAGTIHDVQPAADIVETICQDAMAALTTAAALAKSDTSQPGR